MIRILSLIILISPIFSYGATKILASGQQWDEIAIIDKETSTIEWSMKPPTVTGMNYVSMDKAGNILLGGQNKVMKISRDKKILWEYAVGKNEETNYIKDLDNGNYLIGISGHPARIIEVDKDKNIVNEISFDTKIEKVHGQFRHINISKNGTYLISTLRNPELLEIDKSGKMLSRDKLKEFTRPVFGVIELKNGNLLVSVDGNKAVGSLYELDRNTKKIIRKIQPTQKKLLFPCQVVELENGNLLVANWNGHSKDKTQAKIIEIDKNNKVTWFLKDIPQIKNIASIYVFEE